MQHQLRRLRWKPRRQRPGQDTEFVIGALPLGGFVRMLDEREGAEAKVTAILDGFNGLRKHTATLALKVKSLKPRSQILYLHLCRLRNRYQRLTNFDFVVIARCRQCAHWASPTACTTLNVPQP